MSLTNLIPLRTSFIGREADLRSLHERLAQQPLVTVLGPPGMGKTRLALEYLARFGPTTGAWFCDLSDVKEQDGLCAVVSKVLSIQGGQGAALDIERALSARGPTVLVLDNFEQLVSSAPLLSGWLRAAPQTKLLVTSRERLWLPEEHLFDLRPLSLPAGAESIESSEAAQLFIARARTVRQGFTGDSALLAELVRRLDGIPLAIELCASRCRVLGLPELLKSLDSRFTLLSSRFLGLPKRQQTLSQAIDWSWEMLSTEEQEALSQCVLFEGGFTVEAAQQVWEVSADILDTLSALCDKSLLYRYEVDDESRFGMYLSIREYVSDKALIDLAALRTRHAAYYLRAAESWEREQRSNDEARKRLEREAENLFCIAARMNEDPEQLMSALRALWVFSVTSVKGVPASRFVPLLTRAVEEARQQGKRDALFVKCLSQLAVFKSVLKRHAESLAESQEALRLAESLQDQALLASILYNIGQVMVVLSHPEARQYLERSYALSTAVGDLRAATITLGYLISRLINDGELVGAQRLIEQLDLTQPSATLIQLWGRCNLALARGHGQEAEAHLRAVMEIYARRHYQRGELLCMIQLGTVKLDQAQPAEAETYYQRALTLARTFEEPRMEGIALGYLGMVAQLQGEAPKAREQYQRAILLLRQTAEVAYCGLFTGLLGALLWHSEEGAEGQAYLASALQLFSQVSAPLFFRTVIYLAARCGVSTPEAPRLPAEASTEARVVAKLYEASSLQGLRPPIKEEAPSADALLIEESGRWFYLAAVGKVSLATRKPLARILRRLAELRVQRAGAVLTPREMVRAGWPGEVLEATSARNRLYSTVRMLRNLGLREALLQREDGYLLDPALPLRFVSSEEPA